MTTIGKKRRLARLLHPATGRAVIIPMDHGVSSGPVRGVEDPAHAVAEVVAGGATSVVVHKGLVRHVADPLGGAGLWLHVSAGTSINPDGNDKRLVATVDEAVRLGADGVSIHVNVGAATESRMVEDLGALAGACDAAGMPLLAMMYPRGPAITDPHDVDLVKHVARLAAELGADVIKCPYTGSEESFREVARSCLQPVVISGGPRAETDAEFLRVVRESVDAGGAGVSTGRNVWQRSNPRAMARAVSEIVINDADLETALSYLVK